MCSSQCHDGNRDGSTVHVDRRAKRDRDGINFLVKLKLLAEFHVDRDIGGRASGEERSDPAVFQAADGERPGISLQRDRCDRRTDDQCREQHASDQQSEQLSICCENGESALGDIREYDTADTERRKIDDPPDSF